MADERDDTNPEASSPEHLAAGFPGETTGSFPASHSDADETLVSPAAETEKIGDFEIVGKLGQGGMGAVYRARQMSLNRQVALKILPATLEADADFVARFQREARIAASLNHANLVKVYSSGLADGCHYIAMELIEGENLGQMVKRGPLAPPDALRICLDVAKALQCGWDRAQLIHRDIKPGNIFLSERGEVKVGDLGLARSMSGDTTGLTNTGTAMGTPHYISPEQAKGEKDLDFRADIYSLGCTLYQMLTGRTPYSGSEPMAVCSQHINAPPPAILKVLPSCPIPLARLVGKMLKKAKRERQGSYEELIAQIEDVQTLFAPEESALESSLPPDPDATLLETPGVLATPRSATPVTVPVVRPSAKSRAVLYGGIGAGVVLLLGVVAFLAWPKEEKLTKAQIYARQQENGQKLATPTPSSFSATPPPRAARLWYSPETIPPGRGSSWEKGAMRLDKQGAVVPGSLARDGFWRVSVLMDPDAKDCFVSLRQSVNEQKRSSSYAVHVLPNMGVLVLTAVTANTRRELAKWTLPRQHAANEWLKLEFKVVGDELTVTADGVELGRQRDESIPGPGGAQLYAGEKGYFRDIEYVPLDGVAASTPPETWQTLLNPSKAKVLAQMRRISEGYELVGNGIILAPPSERLDQDGAVRMRTVFKGSGNSLIQLRARYNNVGTYHLDVRDGKVASLTRWEKKGGRSSLVKTFPLPEPLKDGEEYELELRAIGPELTAKLGGQILGTVRDDTHSEGQFGFSFANAEASLIKALDVLDLDNLPANHVNLTHSEQWQDVLHSPVLLSLSGEGIDRVPGGLRITGVCSANIGQREDLTRYFQGRPSSAKKRDGAVRMRASYGSIQPQLRGRMDPHGGLYQLKVQSDKVVLNRFDNVARKLTDLRSFSLPKPLVEGEDYELELRTVGETLAVRFNNELLGSVTDSTYRDGLFGIGVGSVESNASPTVVKSLEFLDLDSADVLNATAPAIATKDTPFVNSLGMKFVPVPITGGPTNGQRVLFSIWETRVQDYGGFATEKGLPWPQHEASREPAFPAEHVSWQDAKDFCQWLTERDRNAGLIGDRECYRLPSDHEWSCAVGIGDKEDPDASPKDKKATTSLTYPWGEIWPPPSTVGNYSGEESVGHEVMPLQRSLRGYRDAFSHTSPVGSFPANVLGIYDLGGNVGEWCEDWLDEGHRTLRGGNYALSSRDWLSSSFRAGLVPNARSYANGFRVVLAPNSSR